MNDSSGFTDWEVEVLYGGRRGTLYIKAPNKTAAEAYADHLLKQRRKKPDTRVIAARERRKAA